VSPFRLDYAGWRRDFAYSAAPDAIASHPCLEQKAHEAPRQTKSMICFVLMALLAGCVEMVVPGQLDALKSGPIQPIGDYKSAIQSYLHDNLRDSMSAVLEYAQPVRDVHLDKPVAGVSHFIACWRGGRERQCQKCIRRLRRISAVLVLVRPG